MSSQPSSKDYKPSEADKTNASVAMSEYNFFKQNYDPLLRQLRDKSLNKDTEKVARGRANADTMQTLTGDRLTKEAIGNPEVEGVVGEALTDQLGQATKQAKNAKTEQSLGVLAGARGQATTAQQGLSQVSRIKTTETLERARNKQLETAAKMKAAGQIGGALVSQGLKNIDTGGTFLTPAMPDPEDASGGGKVLATGLKDRLRYGSWGKG